MMSVCPPFATSSLLTNPLTSPVVNLCATNCDDDDDDDDNDNNNNNNNNNNPALPQTVALRAQNGTVNKTHYFPTQCSEPRLSNGSTPYSVQHGVQVYQECRLHLNRHSRCTVRISCLGATYSLEYTDRYYTNLNSPPFLGSGPTFGPSVV